MQWPPGIRASRPRSLVSQRRLSFVPVVYLTAHAEYGLLHPGFELMLALVPYAVQIELFRATFIAQKQYTTRSPFQKATILSAKSAVVPRATSRRTAVSFSWKFAGVMAVVSSLVPVFRINCARIAQAWRVN